MDSSKLSEMLNSSEEATTVECSDFYGLPSEFSREFNNQYVKDFAEINGDADVGNKIEAYADKFGKLSDNDKKQILSEINRTDVSKAEKFRKIVKEGENYLSNSRYGLVKKYGGYDGLVDVMEKKMTQMLDEIGKLQAEKRSWDRLGLNQSESSAEDSKIQTLEEQVSELTRIVKYNQNGVYEPRRTEAEKKVLAQVLKQHGGTIDDFKKFGITEFFEPNNNNEEI